MSAEIEREVLKVRRKEHIGRDEVTVRFRVSARTVSRLLAPAAEGAGPAHRGGAPRGEDHRGPPTSGTYPASFSA